MYKNRRKGKTIKIIMSILFPKAIASYVARTGNEKKKKCNIVIKLLPRHTRNYNIAG